jgi:hypothetical protein
MKITALIAIAATVMMSCSEGRYPVAPRAEMIDILTELYLYDASLQIYNINNPRAVLNEKFYDSLLARRGMCLKSFKWNIAYYQYKDELGPIMDELIEVLNRSETELQKQEIDREAVRPLLKYLRRDSL